MRVNLLASVLGLGFFLAPALAADWKSTEGQPLCSDMDELREFILAALKKDREWMTHLKTCRILKAGLRLVVIEEFEGAADSIMHVVKVRAIGGTSSLVGYTLKIDK